MKQVIIWWCEVRPVEWMWQQSLSIICDDFCDAHTGVRPTLVMEEEPFRHLSGGMNLRARIQTSKGFSTVVSVHCCSPRQEVHKNNTSVILNGYNHALFNFFILGNVVCSLH
jgi:hypothetical protein